MRRIASIVLVPLVVLAAACTRNVQVESEPAPASSSAFDPVGTYDFSVSMGGMTRTGALHIERSGTGYGGHATLEGESEPATITGVTVSGNSFTARVVPPNGEAVDFMVTMNGNQFTGNVITDMGTIPVTGSKRAN
jgi:hypothetical protein